ncbi:AMP-binding protein, partial [Streptomyces mirabilis]|uniref:AMP-binding protein n=1 Tax=Streptomyces mirabilis TaxID=68239 RepID=UPI0036B5F479
MHERFVEWAGRVPGAVAVVAGDGVLSYGELEGWSNRLAWCLRGLGVGAEVRVGVVAGRSVGFVVGLLAVLKVGGVFVPLDPGVPVGRRRVMVEEAGVGVVVGGLGDVEGLGVGVVGVDVWGEGVAGCSSEPVGVSGSVGVLGGEQLAYVVFTSGSSGVPKGVCVTHGGLAEYVVGVGSVLGLGSGAAFGVVSSLGADLGFTAVFSALCSGGVLHVLPEECVGDPVEFGGYLSRHGVDCVKVTPSLVRALVEGGRGLGVEGVGVWVVGGEALDWGVVRGLREVSPGCRVVNHYGPTESTVGVLAFEVGASVPEVAGSVVGSDGASSVGGSSVGAGSVGSAVGSVGAGSAVGVVGSVPLGWGLGGARVVVLDEWLRPVPVWVEGEVYVGGAGVARGYVGGGGVSAERFVADPVGGGGGRLYRTGDRARRLGGGELVFVGRGDDQVKVRGFRVEPGEVASVLGAHPLVGGVVVVPVVAGGGVRLVAYGVWEGVGEGELREWCEGFLPGYMVPSVFVGLERLPVTANGKVDRSALPAVSVTAGQGASGGGVFEAPVGVVEELLAGVWCEVLGVERVGRWDDFFVLGGDSIMSIQVVARAARLGLGLSTRLLFRYRSVAGVAPFVGGGGGGVLGEQGVVSGGVVMTPVVRWFVEGGGPAGFYNQAVWLRVSGGVDAGVLGRVLVGLVGHHDALRLRLVRDEAGGGGWVLEGVGVEGVVERAVLGVVDLSGVPEAVIGGLPGVLEGLAGAVGEGVEVGSGCLLRGLVVRLGGEDRVLLVAHHLGVDGVSWRVLLEDLGLGYGQLMSGDRLRFPVKTTAFQTWAQHL